MRGLGMSKEAKIKDISQNEQDFADIVALQQSITAKLNEFIVGNRELIELIIISLLTEGHILIEGVPGTAKTTIAKAIAAITGCEFGRIQGAVDIQPADMIGVRIFDPNTREFNMRKGPVFTNILLADELNRVNPKAQSAFIEIMSERHATIDGITMELPSPFVVIATQNPYEQEGTFPLIEAQRDRFMFSMISTYLGAEDELLVIKRVTAGKLDWNTFALTIKPLSDRDKILQSIKKVAQVRLEDPIHTYIRDIVMATRTHSDIDLGASSRASIALVKGAKGVAAVDGRSYVIPDDVKKIAPSVLLHRIYPTREAELEGIRASDIIREILETVEVA
jgi:MoxR-like ATPase